MPQAAHRGRPGLPPVFLLASTDKKKLFAEYEKIAEARIRSFETFRRQWQIHAPEVVIIRPHSDDATFAISTMKHYCDGEVDAIRLLNAGIPFVEVAAAEKPRHLQPMGISADRLHYLNKEIMHYLHSDLLIP